MIEGHGGLRAPAAALAKQLTEELFRLRIHGKDGVASSFVGVDQIGNVSKLSVSVRR